MFPTAQTYILEPYIRGNQPVHIADPKLIESLEKTAGKVIKLLRMGIKFTPTQSDSIRIEQLMLHSRKINQQAGTRIIRMPPFSSICCTRSTDPARNRAVLRRRLRTIYPSFHIPVWHRDDRGQAPLSDKLRRKAAINK